MGMGHTFDQSMRLYLDDLLTAVRFVGIFGGDKGGWVDLSLQLGYLRQLAYRDEACFFAACICIAAFIESQPAQFLQINISGNEMTLHFETLILGKCSTILGDDRMSSIDCICRTLTHT